MKTDMTDFDAANYLDTPEMIAAYLTEVMASEDASLIASALGDIARAKGMTDIARQTGLSRESLYRALSEKGNPELATIIKVLSAAGFSLSAKSKALETT